MIALARFIIVVLVALGLLYWLLSRWLLARKRDQLELAWTEDRGNRELFVTEELAVYQRSIRLWLGLVVIVLPMVYLAAIIYLSNVA